MDFSIPKEPKGKGTYQTSSNVPKGQKIIFPTSLMSEIKGKNFQFYLNPYLF